MSSDVTSPFELPEGRVALVTGGGRGIGRAIALALGKAGASVVVNSTRAETCDPVAAEIVAAGGKAIAAPANVANLEEAEALIKKTTETYGRLDFLINNAGIARDNLLMRMGRDDFDAVIGINLGGPWNMAKAAARTLVKQREGRIINVSSVVGLMGNPGQTNYAASKAGLYGLTKSLAKELAGRNILVNAIAPGFIETDMTSDMEEEAIGHVKQVVPLKRLGTADDVAGAVLFLCSPAANYITGQTIVVDGGMVM